jgi:hypothetical protein
MQGITMTKLNLDNELLCAALAVIGAAFLTGMLKYLVG